MPRSVNPDLAPGETQKIEGITVLRDWERGREGNAEARTQKAQLTIGLPCTPTEGRQILSTSSSALRWAPNTS